MCVWDEKKNYIDIRKKLKMAKQSERKTKKQIAMERSRSKLNQQRLQKLYVSITPSSVLKANNLI